MFATPLIVWMNEHTSVSARHAKSLVTSSLRDLLKPFCKGNFLEQVSFKTGARPGPCDGCLRLWLEFSHSSLCYKGHLVGIGSTQIHQREGDFGSDILCHFMRSTLAGGTLSFQSCGYPYGQRGRIFLFNRNGFSSLTSKFGPCQAVSVFMHESCH